jgi:glycosyltransferase involved in cell wall biosynthesis
MERIVLHSATRVITVCDSIARELEQQYESPRPITVVRNIPLLKSSDSTLQPTINLREVLGLDPTTKILLYQGGVGPSRALEPVIQAMAHVRKAVLVIRGPFIENYSEGFLNLAEQSGARGRVFCLPAVPGSRCVAEAKAADMGLCTLLSICKNFTLALPNKIFEYLSAGLPLLCPAYPEIRKIVETYRVGLCFDHNDPLSIANAINRFAEGDTFLQSCRDNIPAALQDLRADSEWAKLTTLYQEISTGATGECGTSLREAA